MTTASRKGKSPLIVDDKAKIKLRQSGIVSVKQIESALTLLPLEEKQAVRDFLDDLIEDQLEFDSGFKQKIERAKKEIANGVYSRVRQGLDDACL